jgi:hypothetical protein
MMTMVSKLAPFLLVVVMISSCTPREEEAFILVQVRHGKIQVDRKLVNKSDFETTLLHHVEEWEAKGVRREELLVRLKIHEDLKKRTIRDVEDVLAKLGLQKIERTFMHGGG